MWDGRELKSQIDSFMHFRFQYISMEESQKRLSYIVPQVMKQYNIDKVIEVIKEYRCFEDFVDNWKAIKRLILLANGIIPEPSTLLYRLMLKSNNMPSIIMGRSWTLKIPQNSFSGFFTPTLDKEP